MVWLINLSICELSTNKDTIDMHLADRLSEVRKQQKQLKWSYFEKRESQ